MTDADAKAINEAVTQAINYRGHPLDFARDSATLGYLETFTRFQSLYMTLDTDLDGTKEVTLAKEFGSDQAAGGRGQMLNEAWCRAILSLELGQAAAVKIAPSKESMTE